MVDYANGAETLGALTLRRMDAPSAREIANWRYAPPHGIYNCAPGKAEEAVEHLLNPEHRCFSVWDDAGSLVGCLGFGDDGGVPGGDHSASALDLGGGLRPDRTGQGLGASLIQAALAFGRRHRAPVAFRATVAAFGRRALQVWARAGCCQVGSFAHAGSREPFEETFEGQVTFRRLKHALQRAALPVLHSPAGASKATARAVLQETSDWHARDLSNHDRMHDKIGNQKPVLVLGGTGHFGRHIVASLRKRGAPVRVLSRHAAPARQLLGEGAEILEGDITLRGSVAEALAGARGMVIAVSAF